MHITVNTILFSVKVGLEQHAFFLNKNKKDRGGPKNPGERE
jgi:hypothetical protein